MGATVLKALNWLGSLGSKGIAAGLFLGIALPWLAAAFKPLLQEAIIVMLAVAFLRVRPEAIGALRATPWRVVLVAVTMLIVTPLVVGTLMMVVAPADPGIRLGLALQVSAPPTMTSAAFALLLGLEAAYAIALLLAAMALTPLTAPVMAAFVTGEAVPIDTLSLAIRLAFVIAGAVGAAFVVRLVVGQDRLDRHKGALDGITMLLLLFFAIAVMDGVAWMLWQRPLYLFGLLILIFGVSLAMTAVTFALFRTFGFDVAMTAGLSSGNRNMGVLIAAWTTTLPESTWLYFAMAQFPVYLAPILLGWAAKRLRPKVP